MGDVISTVLPYKFLSLRMTQKGNNDPVYTVLANTLDFDVESLDVNRTGTGEYLVRLFSDVLTDLKTSFVVGFNPLGSQIIFLIAVIDLLLVLLTCQATLLMKF